MPTCVFRKYYSCLFTFPDYFHLQYNWAFFLNQICNETPTTLATGVGVGSKAPELIKVFSVLQPSRSEEDSGGSEELNQAVCKDNYRSLDNLLCQAPCYAWPPPRAMLRAWRSSWPRGQRWTTWIWRLKPHSSWRSGLATGNSWTSWTCEPVLPAASAKNCSPLLITARDGDMDTLRQHPDHGVETMIKWGCPSGLPTQWPVPVQSTSYLHDTRFLIPAQGTAQTSRETQEEKEAIYLQWPETQQPFLSKSTNQENKAHAIDTES